MPVPLREVELMSRKWLKGDCLGLVDEVYHAGASVLAVFSVNVAADCCGLVMASGPSRFLSSLSTIR